MQENNPWVTQNDDETVTLRLRYPTKYAGEMYTELRFRTGATGADLRAMDKHDGENAKVFAAIARLANVPLALLDQLRSVDALEAAKVALDILGKEPSPPAGKTS